MGPIVPKAPSPWRHCLRRSQPCRWRRLSRSVTARLAGGRGNAGDEHQRRSEALADVAFEIHAAREQVERLIEAKAHGKKLTVMPRRKPEAEPDLMKALQISLATGSKQRLLKVANASQKPSKGRKAG